jgi:GAF domain-containing protein
MYKVHNHDDAQQNYEVLYAAVCAHLEDEDDLIANLANIAAFIYHSLDKLNWAGFYLMKGGQLVLGPFVGKPACTRIDLDKGVCGGAATEKRVIVVPDVHKFPGHIACDGDTNSEIVLPLYKNGEVFGVLDIDSPVFDRFGAIDEEWLTKIAGAISNFLDK